MFHKVQHQFNGYSMFGIIHHYWSSCFIKYNTNSAEVWLISLYVLTQFYSVAIFNWEKRMCRQDFGFIEYPLCHWPRKQMKNEIKTKMKSKPCGWGLSVSSGGLNHHTMHSSCLVESKVFSLFARASLFSAGYGKVRPTKSEAKKTKCQ